MGYLSIITIDELRTCKRNIIALLMKIRVQCYQIEGFERSEREIRRKKGVTRMAKMNRVSSRQSLDNKRVNKQLFISRHELGLRTVSIYLNAFC